MRDFLQQLPEAFVSTAELSQSIGREVARGSMRKLDSRLYTKNMTDEPKRIVLRNLWPIVASYLPGALIADRTALENRPASDGSIMLIAPYSRNIRLPGITLKPRPGPAALDTDRPFIGALRLSSPARAYLENMRPSRARSGVSRTLSKSEIEERLDTLLRQGGEAALQALREDARVVADQLELPVEFDRLAELIGALLGTRKATLLSPLTKARTAGSPYDPARLALFEALRSELATTALPLRLAKATDGPPLPFFEAYFSNFIEGTEFAVDEAEAIIFQGVVPPHRPADAHDIIGTYQIASDPREMARRPRDCLELLDLLTSRHAVVMAGRPEARPGQFKAGANRAGQTLFVSPDLVKGTLATGFEVYRSLDAPLARAIFMMFLITEVHPFDDGNGRVARLMMNAELVAAGEARIIIPTVYRNNYVSALKALSQNAMAAPLVRVLLFAQNFTSGIDFSDLEGARVMLEQSNAFMDSTEAELRGLRLRAL